MTDHAAIVVRNGIVPENYPNGAAALAALDALIAERDEARRETVRWLSWSEGQYPDDSPGDVIAIYEDGTIILDDSVTTWNPLRALGFAMARAEAAEAERDALAAALREIADTASVEHDNDEAAFEFTRAIARAALAANTTAKEPA